MSAKHSTANLFPATEEAKEPVVVSHWRWEDPCMQLGMFMKRTQSQGLLLVPTRALPIIKSMQLLLN